jgi:hypothetical protein
MVAQDGVVGSSAIGNRSKAFGGPHRRIGHRFCRSEATERVRRYLVGLLGRVERARTAGDPPRPSASEIRRACNDCRTPPGGTRMRSATT